MSSHRFKSWRANVGAVSSSDELAEPVFVAIDSNGSAAGEVEWNTLANSTKTLRIVIPEDTSLRLKVAEPTDELVIAITTPPTSGAAAVFDGQLEYTPDADFFGTDLIRFQRFGQTITVLIELSPVNDAPRVVGDIDRVAEQGVPFSTQLQVRNVDFDALTFSSSGLPSWLSFDAQTGVLSGTPEQGDVGIHELIRLIVRDPEGLDDALRNVSIEVLDLNDAPSLNITQFPASLDARQTISVNVFPDDIDGDAVTLLVEPNDFIRTDVIAGQVSVTALDVNEVTAINMVLVATDQLGRKTRAVVPFVLYPLTSSGNGRTVQGQRTGAGVHLVVIGDGYRQQQSRRFRADVDQFIQTMASDPAVNSHMSAWNIHMVEAWSVDSGIDDNVAVDIRDTVFDSGYFCSSIPRLICGNQGKMLELATQEYPDMHQLVMLVNDPRYGGSGGSVAIASALAPEIALHEMGHSFAGLADEYVDSSLPPLSVAAFEEGGFPNVSTQQDPSLVPWHAWINTDETIPSLPSDTGVGIFRGGFYNADGFYRPTYDSRMRSFDEPFGPVNGEAWALAVYRTASPVTVFSPRQNSVDVDINQIVSFLVEPLFGTDVQRVVWTLNGRLLSQDINTNELNLRFSPGQHVLTVSVNDLTGSIRQPAPHDAIFEWSWEVVAR